MRSSREEDALIAPLFVEISEEIKTTLCKMANEENIPLNHLVNRLLAKSIKRPDLERIPAKRVGRPFKVAK